MEYIGHFIVGAVFLLSDIPFGWCVGIFLKKIFYRVNYGKSIIQDGEVSFALISAIASPIMFLLGLAGWEVILYSYYGSWTSAPNSFMYPPIAIAVPLAATLLGVLLYVLYSTISEK